MPQPWQCDVCGARYRVAWLSHCYRCEGRPPKPRPKPEKQSKPRRGRMPRIVAGVGPSNARAELEQGAPEPELVHFEFSVPAEPEPAPEPVAAPVEPEPVPAPVEAAPEPAEAPAPAAAAPKDAPKAGAA